MSHITFAAFIISFYMCQHEYILLSNETGLLPWLLSLPFCYYDRNQHTKLLQLKKTNFYSLFKNVVKAESHTLHSYKGQRKFIALLCKILNLNDKVNLIALSNELVMKCCNWVLYGNKLYSIKWMKSINQIRKWAMCNILPLLLSEQEATNDFNDYLSISMRKIEFKVWI